MDSILLAVLTVSPNKQYRGILLPTIPATTGPVWAPLRICSRSPGRLGTWKTEDAANRSRAIVAISDTCLSPVFGFFFFTMSNSFGSGLNTEQNIYCDAKKKNKKKVRETTIGALEHSLILIHWNRERGRHTEDTPRTCRTHGSCTLVGLVLLPFLTGRPDATMYESPIVSTLYTS